MDFAARLSQLAQSPDTRDHQLCAGSAAVSYAELPERLDQIGAWLAEQGMDGTDCLALECRNSLPGALALLWLLREGRSFALLPPSAEEGSASGRLALGFCRWALSAGPSTAGALDCPGHGLRLRIHPGYAPGPDVQPGKLYARTSGSLAVSKLVAHDQAKLLANARNCAQRYGYQPEDRISIPVPIFNLYGGAAAFLPAVLTGANLDLIEDANLLRYLDRERLFRPSAAYLTPSLCEMLLKGFREPRAYRFAVTSGQHIAEDLFRAFDQRIGGHLVNQYGSTELGAVAASPPDAPLSERLRAVGLPMPGVELAIRRSGAGAGLLWCRHPYGFEGYLDPTGHWLQQTSPEGWTATSDLAEPGPAGQVRLLGRCDRSANRRGHRVLLSELEERLEAMAEIGLAAVVAHGDTAAERITAFCVAAESRPVTAAGVRAACLKSLPAYAVPDTVVLLAELPLLPSGKTDLRSLADLAVSSDELNDSTLTQEYTP